MSPCLLVSVVQYSILFHFPLKNYFKLHYKQGINSIKCIYSGSNRYIQVGGVGYSIGSYQSEDCGLLTPYLLLEETLFNTPAKSPLPLIK